MRQYSYKNCLKNYEIIYIQSLITKKTLKSISLTIDSKMKHYNEIKENTIQDKELKN